MQRVLVYSHADGFLFELSENEVYSLRRYSAINGQHYLDIETSTVLEKGMRILTSDERGMWHEHVVSKTDEDHASGEYMTGKYRCFWSLQHDLTVSRTNHILNNATAREALTAALSGTNRWAVGQVTVVASASASMYRTTAWQALQTLVKTWGGEVEAVIGVDQTGVISRSVNLLTHVGSSEVTRRFDYGEDMTSISRQADDSPLVCRIIPLGKGEQSGDGYGRKITIESVNGGLDYLQNDSMAPLVRMPNGSGGWEYPYAYVENGDIEDPQELKDWALSILEEATSPKVTYKANVLQLSLAGMDAFGVSEGDPVYCVDRTFTTEGIRVYGRVTALDEDLLEPSNTKLTIGYMGKSVVTSTATTVASLSGSLGRLQANASGAIDLTDAYVQAVINRLNEEANVTGGYFYYVVGEGVRTYDVAVSDPSVGSEASKVVEIKGGTIRIANSRTSGGDWDWKTVFVSGHVAAELVTAANLIAGYIGSATSGNYWNLDTGEFRMAATSVTVDNSTLANYVNSAASDALTQQAVFDALTNNGALQGLYMSGGQLYINAEYLKSGKIKGIVIESYTSRNMPSYPSGTTVYYERIRFSEGHIQFQQHEFVDTGTGSKRPSDADNWITYGDIYGYRGPTRNLFYIEGNDVLEERAVQVQTEATNKRGYSIYPSDGVGQTGLLKIPIANANYMMAFKIVNGRITKIGRIYNSTPSTFSDEPNFTETPDNS